MLYISGNIKVDVSDMDSESDVSPAFVALETTSIFLYKANLIIKMWLYVMNQLNE